MARVGRDLKDHESPTPCHTQGHQPHLMPAQAAQGPIQPGLEHLQGRGIHSLSGQLFQHLTALSVKNSPLTSNPITSRNGDSTISMGSCASASQPFGRRDFS